MSATITEARANELAAAACRRMGLSSGAAFSVDPESFPHAVGGNDTAGRMKLLKKKIASLIELGRLQDPTDVNEIAIALNNLRLDAESDADFGTAIREALRDVRAEKTEVGRLIVLQKKARKLAEAGEIEDLSDLEEVALSLAGTMTEKGEDFDQFRRVVGQAMTGISFSLNNGTTTAMSDSRSSALAARSLRSMGIDPGPGFALGAEEEPAPLSDEAARLDAIGDESLRRMRLDDGAGDELEYPPGLPSELRERWRNVNKALGAQEKRSESERWAFLLQCLETCVR